MWPPLVSRLPLSSSSFEPATSFQVTMSSSTWLNDEAVGKGQGYVYGASESSSLVGSSILGSDGEKNVAEITSEREVEMEVDTAKEWTDTAYWPLDPNVRITELLQYNLNLEEKLCFRGMSTVELLDMAYELNVWANICLTYAAGSTKSLMAKELEVAQKDLEASQKENQSFSLRLAEILKAAKDDREKVTTCLT